MTRFTANLLLLIAALVWGAAFVAQATAMETMGPLNFTGIRFLLAAVAVGPLAYIEWRKAENPLSRGAVVKGILVGVVFFTGITLQQYGFLTTTVTNAGFLTALYVVLTPIMGILIFRTLPSPFVWPIVALSMTGTYLLAGGIGAMQPGDILMISSALFWALQIIFVGRMVSRYGNPMAFAFLQFATAGALGLGSGLLLEPLTLSSIQGAWFEIIYTGVFSGALAFGLQAVAQRYTPPADAAILLSSESLFAAIFGAIILGERQTNLQYLGCVMIFSCILLVELLPQIQKWLKRKERANQPA